MKVRKPVVAGRFYSEEKNALKNEVRKYLNEGEKKRKLAGAIVPHAGFIYSGRTAGAVYSRVSPPSVAVIIGPNHTGRGELCSVDTAGNWETPLGELEIDSVLAGEIIRESKFLTEDKVAHRDEHSVEVQIPFLQYIRDDIKIVPMVLGDCGIEICRDIGKAVSEAIKKTGSDGFVIGSSDMTHYEPSDSARQKDEKAIDAICKMDEEAFINTVRNFQISMCGYIPAAVCIIACKKLGARKAELVSYTNSGEVSGDMSQVVGYAGIIMHE